MDSFFGIGPMELVFILIFALIFLGPERLPQVLREVVIFLRKVRALSDEITSQINQELGDLQELRDLDPRRPLQDTLRSVTQPPESRPPRSGSAPAPSEASSPSAQESPAPPEEPGRTIAPPEAHTARSETGPNGPTGPDPVEEDSGTSLPSGEKGRDVDEGPEATEVPRAQVEARQVSQGDLTSPASAPFLAGEATPSAHNDGHADRPEPR